MSNNCFYQIIIVAAFGEFLWSTTEAVRYVPKWKKQVGRKFAFSLYLHCVVIEIITSEFELLKCALAVITGLVLLPL